MMKQRLHVLYDIRVRDGSRLARLADWPEWLGTTATAAGATILHSRFHQFEPAGFTGFLLLAESHISMHTWPEENLATVDIFTCGDMRAEEILAALRQRLDVVAERVQQLSRTPD